MVQGILRLGLEQPRAEQALTRVDGEANETRNSQFKKSPRLAARAKLRKLTRAIYGTGGWILNPASAWRCTLFIASFKLRRTRTRRLTNSRRRIFRSAGGRYAASYWVRQTGRHAPAQILVHRPGRAGREVGARAGCGGAAQVSWVVLSAGRAGLALRAAVIPGANSGAGIKSVVGGAGRDDRTAKGAG